MRTVTKRRDPRGVAEGRGNTLTESAGGGAPGGRRTIPAGPPGCGTNSAGNFLSSWSSLDSRGTIDEDGRNVSRWAMGDVGGATNTDVLDPEMSMTEDEGADRWSAVDIRTLLKEFEILP